ncbi:PilZ domain-containing protein [Methylobacterium sp. E-005]|uniref:PilZ domain-containing protein n=1 Tax=Methylobacterium sp. E-005 TaxID=2836549 RepID=UPI001FB92C1A|nr:PilZ domain-containing protein [Methylobacterium sp. E-005]MCJ2087938.1 PilZ domain-containing protein [Methylobacterium sp. E-005]
MNERRAEDRTCLNIPGMILVDEHRTLPCLIADRSATGIRVTLPNPENLPDVFILTFDDTREALVCRAAWRKADQIGCIADVLVTAWLVQPLRRPPVAWH